MIDKIKVKEALEKLRKMDEFEITALNTFEELSEKYIAGEICEPMSKDEIEKIIRNNIKNVSIDELIEQDETDVELIDTKELAEVLVNAQKGDKK